jgi:hypothetical protein
MMPWTVIYAAAALESRSALSPSCAERDGKALRHFGHGETAEVADEKAAL